MADDGRLSNLPLALVVYGDEYLEMIQRNRTTGEIKNFRVAINTLRNETGSGADGKSAFELAVDAGFTGSVEEWLESLKGQDGAPGTNGLDGVNGVDGAPGADGLDGTPGVDGLSAYQVAVQQGFVGDTAAWLLSLKGTDGKSAYELAVLNGYEGTQEEYIAEIGQFFTTVTEIPIADPDYPASPPVGIVLGAPVVNHTHVRKFVILKEESYTDPVTYTLEGVTLTLSIQNTSLMELGDEITLFNQSKGSIQISSGAGTILYAGTYTAIPPGCVAVCKLIRRIDSTFYTWLVNVITAIPAAALGEPISTTYEITASESLAAGDLVNIWNNAGTVRVRKAHGNEAGYQVHGFVLAAVAANALATVHFSGINDQCSDLTIGEQYLSTTPGKSSAIPPSTNGLVLQTVGVAVSPTTLIFDRSDAVILA